MKAFENKINGEIHDDRRKLVVQQLFTHPIKSCKVIEVDRINVSAQGLQYDREFSFAYYTEMAGKETDERSMGWQFVTQRGIPALATVHARHVPLDSDSTSDTELTNAEGSLEISWPSRNSDKPWFTRIFSRKGHGGCVRLPFHPTDSQIKKYGYKFEKFNVWKDTTDALMMASTEEGEGSIWLRELTEYLKVESLRQNSTFSMRNAMNKPFALFRIRRERPREVFRNAPMKKEAGYQPIVGFQDSYPLSIQNLASVQDLASRLDDSYPSLNVKNFRPNIVFGGLRAYEEDHWKRIRIGQSEYYVTNRTSRCKLPNVDQETGKKHAEEPDKTMRAFRKIDSGCKNHACLGMMMVPVSPDQNEIRVGDEIHVLETGQHLYVMQ